ncbi:hypothetical protein Y032_0080g1340 [Ancylostoma ceylanicum]|uniref:Uncharacterized protein n=1 Tax=Ancylostoma ceylanicum TaxID=53326 RepID=A0A016TRS2_9BILA|nr:hypothetical protein Y032_0080g1340 [Ancylostoma ceylanicum]
MLEIKSFIGDDAETLAEITLSNNPGQPLKLHNPTVGKIKQKQASKPTFASCVSKCYVIYEATNHASHSWFP